MKAGAAGGIDVVVKAINTHINNAGVCKHGFSALFNMTANNGKTSDKMQINNKTNTNEMNS